MKNQKDFSKIAVCSLDVLNLTNTFPELKGYYRIFVVFKFKDSVVGKSIFKLENGLIDIDELKEYVEKISYNIWTAMIKDRFSKNIKLPFVSVVVCSHNRVDELKNCLDSLSNLDYPEKEIIVVDSSPVNNETYNLLTGYPQFIYYREEQIGLDIARNTGLRIAKGEFVAFTDDDARVDQSWLKNLIENFSNPATGIVTGITMPYELETEAQVYFEMTNGFNRGFLRREFDSSNLSPIAAGNVGAGVNMAIRKSVLGETGLFDEALDGGMLTCSGGDQEFFYRVLLNGYRIVYEPKALVWHRHRQNFKNLKNTIYGYGVGVFAWWTRALFYEQEFKLLFYAPVWFVKYHLKNLVKAIVFSGNKIETELAYLELIGALNGPFKYFKARRRLRNTKADKIIKLNAYTPKEILEVE
jgi:GT2 family glycosyltransferase